MSEPRPVDTGAWQRWRMDTLATPRPAAAGQDAPDPALVARQRRERQQAQLHALQEQARERGHAEGLAAGKAEGHAQGYAQGLAEGRQAGQQELETHRQQLEAPLRELAHGLRVALDHLDADIADTLTDVALAAAHRLAGDALDARPRQILAIIRDLLREEPLFSGHPRLWLHPEDLALLDAQLLDELDAAGWKVQPDTALTRGGCRVTGPEGELNATREARWQALLARARRYGSTPISHTETTAPAPPAEPTP